MGLKLAALAAALAVTPVGFLHAHQSPDGGFAEAGGSQGPLLTAWAALGLRASGADTGKALDYLRVHEDGLTETTDVELVALAESALGAKADELLARIRTAQRADGRIGPNVNSTIWGILALRQARQQAPRAAVRFVLRQQARSGGWAWYLHGQPDSNDTAAAIEALRAAGVTGKPIRRGLAYLHRPAEPRRRLRAHPGPRLGRAVDGLGGAGLRRSRPPRAEGLDHLPAAPAPARRQLPLLEALRDDAGLGHRPGAAGARPEAVSARVKPAPRPESHLVP